MSVISYYVSLRPRPGLCYLSGDRASEILERVLFKMGKGSDSLSILASIKPVTGADQPVVRIVAEYWGDDSTRSTSYSDRGETAEDMRLRGIADFLAEPRNGLFYRVPIEAENAGECE